MRKNKKIQKLIKNNNKNEIFSELKRKNRKNDKKINI